MQFFGFLAAWTVTEWTAVIVAVTTVVYTLGTFLLWRGNNATNRLLSSQIKFQTSANLSNAHHSVLDANRDLLVFLLGDRELCSLLSEPAEGLDNTEIRKMFVGTLFINHCLRIYMDYDRGVLDSAEMESFKRDAAYLFRLSIIRDRWCEVRNFHPDNFVKFIESDVLPLVPGYQGVPATAELPKSIASSLEAIQLRLGKIEQAIVDLPESRSLAKHLRDVSVSKPE